MTGHHLGILRHIDVEPEQLGHSHFTARPNNSDLLYLISQNLGQLGHDNPVTRDPIAGSPIFCPHVHSNLPLEDALIMNPTLHHLLLDVVP